MFYLKYRPKTIAEIDNTRIKETVKKILESSNLPHAFLFIGQKGTGKTSVARIFSKSINCLNNKFASDKKGVVEPCNKCPNCQSIANSSFTDVLELDAASNRGIEEVKNLIRETSFLPMVGRYRVFIIDEAHMITNDGFNALLKTLEEPPSTAVFILATTNLEKIPKTIISRCVKVNFGKARKDDIVNMLHRYIKSEELQFNDALIRLIAQHSESSFRDAAKILEEFVIQKIDSIEQGEKFLGVRGKGNLLQVLARDDLKTTMTWIEDFAQAGGNFKNLIESLLEELRLILLAKKGLNLTDEEISEFSLSDTILLIKLLMEAYTDLKSSPIESLPLELAVVEFYNRKH